MVFPLEKELIVKVTSQGICTCIRVLEQLFVSCLHLPTQSHDENYGVCVVILS